MSRSDPSESRLLLVVAAALIDQDGRVLVTQRLPGKSFAGMWEFPGGKVDPGEAPAAALARELLEELGIKVEIEALEPLSFASERLGDRDLVLLLYLCRKWRGVAVPLQVAALQWVDPADLGALEMPPADRPLIAALERLSSRGA